MNNDGGRDDRRQTTGMRTMLTDAEQQARTFVEQRPVAAVLVALGIGFIVARAAARL